MKKLTAIITAVLMLFSVTPAFGVEDASSEVETVQSEQSETGAVQPESAEPEGKVYYVSAEASTGGDGSVEKPFSNIESARNAVRSMKKTEPITVIIRGGEYYLGNSLEFTNADSGTESAPVTYKAYNGEKVIIHGSVDIPRSNISQVTDESVISRLQGNVRGKVYEIKLPSGIANNMGNVFEAKVGTYDHSHDFNMLDVFDNGELMPMSQWPNGGFADVESMSYKADEPLLNVIFGEEYATRFSKWSSSFEDVVMSYYTKAGYEHFFAPVVSVSSKDRTVYLNKENVMNNPSYERVGPSANARAVFMNLLEEIDMPGEYVVDRKNKKIYMYIEGGKASNNLSVSLTNKPLIQFNGASNINLQGVTVGYCRSDAVSIINKSKNIVIDGCEICNAGTNGVYANSSTEITLKNSQVYNVGSNGVFIEKCGSDVELIESGIKIINNDIHSVGRLKKCATGGITTDYSCGVEISKNRIHRIPHQGVWIANTPIVKVDRNEVYDAVRETMDAGALYVNGGVEDWGCEFTNNFIHDVTNDLSGRGSTHGTYADAQHHNVRMDNNIFYNVESGAAFQNGGSFGSISNNIFIDCPVPTIFTNYKNMRTWITRGREEGLATANKNAYLKRFPEMERWLEFDADDEARRECVGTEMYNNVSVNYKMSDSTFESLMTYKKRVENNVGSKSPSYFGWNVENMDYGFDFSYTKDDPVFDEISDFNVIDFENIGVDHRVELKPVTLIGPENDSENVEGNNAIFKWRGTKGCYRYRIIVSIDKNFDAIVADEIVDDTHFTLSTLKYGLRDYYWKVIPVKGSKADVVVDAQPLVFHFKTAKSEALNKTELRNMVTKLGNGFANFDYPQEQIAAVTTARDSAKAVLDNNKAKQSNVRAQTKALNKAVTAMYDSTIVKSYDLDTFLKDPEGWAGSKNPVKESNAVTIVPGDDRVLSYANTRIEPGETVKFTLKFNPTNYQSIGICDSSTERLWGSPGYSAVMRLGYIELQRYNYNAEGQLEGGIIEYFPSKGMLYSNMWMLCEFGYSRVHNGTRVVLKVDGVTLIDYVDTSSLAVTDGGHFRIENGSPTENISAGSVNNDTSKAGVTDM